MDPLVWSRCGQRMSVIAFLTDHVSVKRILDHLGLSTPPQDKPVRSPQTAPSHRALASLYSRSE